LDRAGKGKEFRHRGIPQKLTHKSDDRDGDQKSEDRRHRILIHVLFRGTGQIGHSLYTCTAHGLKHFYFTDSIFIVGSLKSLFA
jgi:hypothetical protein